MAGHNFNEYAGERLSYNKHNLRKARKQAAFTGYAYFLFTQIQTQGGTNENKKINCLRGKRKKLQFNSKDHTAGAMAGRVGIFHRR